MIILVALIIFSLAETICNLVLNTEFSKFNLGEPFATFIFSAIILFFTCKKKDRICYICYGAWIAWFAMDQIFELPGMISTLCSTLGNIEALVAADTAVHALVSIGLRMVIMICIIAIGALLIEYMNDGTIYNKAFNVLCVITILSLLASAIWGLMVMKNTTSMIVYVINSLSRIAMVFMTTFFAYDSAKMQLKKTDLTK